MTDLIYLTIKNEINIRGESVEDDEKDTKNSEAETKNNKEDNKNSKVETKNNKDDPKNNKAELRCDECGITTFRTNQAYQRHIQSNKHKLRQGNTRADLFQCNRCNKWYCGKTGLCHHKSVCRAQSPLALPHPPPLPPPIISIHREILHQQQMEEMKQSFDKDRQSIKKEIEEKMKEQINKILEQHVGGGTTINNTNYNETHQNIYIHINAFGNENTDYLDDKAILACIGSEYKSILPSLLEKIHFDPKHPENHNIKITNKKLPYASVMGNNHKWKTVDRKDAIETMVLNGYNMLDEKYTENKESFTTQKQQNFESFQTKFESEDKELMKQIKTEVDMMIINGGI